MDGATVAIQRPLEYRNDSVFCGLTSNTRQILTVKTVEDLIRAIEFLNPCASDFELALRCQTSFGVSANAMPKRFGISRGKPYNSVALRRCVGVLS